MGDRIRSLRLAAGMTQEELSRRMGYKGKSATVSQWESGKRMPRTKDSPRLAKVLGCKVEDLISVI